MIVYYDQSKILSLIDLTPDGSWLIRDLTSNRSWLFKDVASDRSWMIQDIMSNKSWLIYMLNDKKKLTSWCKMKDKKCLYIFACNSYEKL